jgi:hypothetical protein
LVGKPEGKHFTRKIETWVGREDKDRWRYLVNKIMNGEVNLNSAKRKIECS